jgi:hypothetical protein
MRPEAQGDIQPPVVPPVRRDAPTNFIAGWLYAPTSCQLRADAMGALKAAPKPKPADAPAARPIAAAAAFAATTTLHKEAAWAR